MSRLDEARERLSRAKALVAVASNDSLQYATLELRQCVELLIYDKLELFAQYLPASFLKGTWQADKLLRAMKQIDPDADVDRSATMDYLTEESPGVLVQKCIDLGEHKAIRHRWLRDTYHKLGSRLHASVSGQRPDSNSESKFLLAVAEEIEEALSSSLASMFVGQIRTIQCDVCHQEFGVSWHYLRTQPSFQCLNEKCEAMYRVDSAFAEKVDYKLWTATLTCATCGHRNIREARHLRDGQPWDCEQCRRHYVVKQWNVEAVPILPALVEQRSGSIEEVAGGPRNTRIPTLGGPTNRLAKRLSIAGAVAGCLSAIAYGSAILHPFHGLEYTGGPLNTLTARTPDYAHWAEINDGLAFTGLVLVVVATALQIAAVKLDD